MFVTIYVENLVQKKNAQFQASQCFSYSYPLLMTKSYQPLRLLKESHLTGSVAKISDNQQRKKNKEAKYERHICSCCFDANLLKKRNKPQKMKSPYVSQRTACLKVLSISKCALVLSQQCLFESNRLNSLTLHTWISHESPLCLQIKENIIGCRSLSAKHFQNSQPSLVHLSQHLFSFTVG